MGAQEGEKEEGKKRKQKQRKPNSDRFFVSYIKCMSICWTFNQFQKVDLKSQTIINNRFPSLAARKQSQTSNFQFEKKEAKIFAFHWTLLSYWKSFGSSFLLNTIAFINESLRYPCRLAYFHHRKKTRKKLYYNSRKKTNSCWKYNYAVYLFVLEDKEDDWHHSKLFFFKSKVKTVKCSWSICSIYFLKHRS